MGKVIELERFTCFGCNWTKLKRLKEDFDLHLCPQCGGILFWGEMSLTREILKSLRGNYGPDKSNADNDSR